MARHLLLLLPVLLLFISPSSAAPHPRPRSHLTTLELTSLLPFLAPSPPQPSTFFEVARPIPAPPRSRLCSTLVLSHTFANTYGQPPVTAPIRPCAPVPASRIVLRFSADSRGRQFDRIFGVWAAGVELLRSCTAEPRPSGILWSVRKDVSRYSSLLSRPSTLSVHLANVVDQTYTGVYHVNVTLDYYYYYHPHHHLGRDRFSSACRTAPADLVLPISREAPPDDGLWFRIPNATASEGKALAVPRSARRAVLEVYLSFHGDDEFWYTNPPNDYIAANNLSGVPGNGPFREVVASVDGRVVGVIWPFTVIYTGGVNPLLWRPISGIGSFNLPSYDLELTPFLGELLDGAPHRFAFTVTNTLGYWLIDANLHLWLDAGGSAATGKLVSHSTQGAVRFDNSQFQGLDGSFLTEASRSISASGWVSSPSHGNITTSWNQELRFSNSMVFSGDGSNQVVNQTIGSEQAVLATSSQAVVYSETVSRQFPLYLYTGITNVINGSYESLANVSFAFDETQVAGTSSGWFFLGSLRNSQHAQGAMRVNGSLVMSGVGRTRQSYRYEGTDGCYFRDVRSDNYTILEDESGESCGLDSRLAEQRVGSNIWSL